MNTNNKNISINDIDKINMGKDQQRGMQFALKEILSVGINRNKSISERYKKSLEVSRSFGDTGKLVSTIFETLDQIKPTGLSSVGMSNII